MAIAKSNILKKLSKSYPNFLKKDLEKFINIIFNEIKRALRRGDRVELREVFSLEPRIQKARISRSTYTSCWMAKWSYLFESSPFAGEG